MVRAMERHRLLRGFGWFGLAVGMGAMAAGSVAGELAGFVTGYGLLVVLSSAYLLIGLALRGLVARRARPSHTHVPALSHR